MSARLAIEVDLEVLIINVSVKLPIPERLLFLPVLACERVAFLHVVIGQERLLTELPEVDLARVELVLDAARAHLHSRALLEHFCCDVIRWM